MIITLKKKMWLLKICKIFSDVVDFGHEKRIDVLKPFELCLIDGCQGGPVFVEREEDSSGASEDYTCGHKMISKPRNTI